MSWTKRQIIMQSFSEIGLSGAVFQLSPQMLSAALNRLDTMMADWNGVGLRLSYPTSSSPDDSDLDQASNLPDWSVRAVYLNLAVSTAASMGNAVSDTLRKTADEALSSVTSRFAGPIERARPANIPAGAGNRTWGVYPGPFLPPSPAQIQTGSDGELTFD